MSARGVRGWITAAAALLACAGCGYKGPLYLPEHNATVVTHPAQAAPPSGQPGSPAKSKSKASQPASAPPAAQPAGSSPPSPPGAS